MAQKNVKPDWFYDVDSVFPKEDFIAEIGAGKTEEEAQSYALAAIARRFNVSVKNSVTATYDAIEEGEKLTEIRHLVNNVDLKSSVDLCSVEATQPFFDKKEKKYYLVVYIKRDSAFLLYEPVLKQKQTVFMEFFNKAQNSTEPFEKYEWYKNAWDSSFDYLEALSFAQIFCGKTELSYEKDRNILALIPALIKYTAKECTVSVTADMDYKNHVKQAVSEVFSNLGFTVVKVDSSKKYTAEILINEHLENSGELFVLYPEIELNLIGKNKKIMYNRTYKLGKVAAYSKEKAREKAFEKIAVEIKNNLSAELGL
ncbi:MAG: hypothetical protein ACTTHG_01545 [Treponemataceae bacterium]